MFETCVLCSSRGCYKNTNPDQLSCGYAGLVAIHVNRSFNQAYGQADFIIIIKTMTHRTYLILLIIGATILSCQTEEKPTSVSFKKEINTADLEVFDIPAVLWKEKTIFCTDDFLVTNSATKDTLFRVFDLKNLDYLGGFGTYGEGPEEYNVIASSLYSPYSNAIHVGTFRNNRIVEVERDMQNSTIITRLVEEHRTPGELVPLNWSFKLNDTSFVGEKSFSIESELAYFNTRDRSTGTMLPYPDLVENLTPIAKSMVYQKKLRVSRDKSKIITAYTRFPLIRIYDVESKEVKNVFVQVAPEFEQTSQIRMDPDGMNINHKDLFMYYVNLEATEKFIYAQLLVMGWDVNLERLKLHYPSELHVFDVEGAPQLKIKLEDWMNIYAPSQDDEYIYFWNSEIEDKLYRLPIGDKL